MYSAHQNGHCRALKMGQGMVQSAGHAGGMVKAWNTVNRLRQQGFIHYVKVAGQLACPAVGPFKAPNMQYFKELATLRLALEGVH